MNLSAVILAGGKSSRMGRDKAFLEVGGQTLLARQIRILNDAGATKIFISGRADADYSTFGCRVLADKVRNAGPLAGIEAALGEARERLLLVLAVDLPVMDACFLHGLVESCANGVGVIPRVADFIEPLAAIYPRRAQGIAETMLQKKEFAVHDFARACVGSGLAVFRDFPKTFAGRFKNLNFPSDLPSPA